MTQRREMSKISIDDMRTLRTKLHDIERKRPGNHSG